jgi:hypothetical protein
MMQVTEDGHFIFDCDDEKAAAARLIRAIHKHGKVDTDDEFWRRWLLCKMGQRVLTDYNVVLVWTTVFLPRLMFSLICHLQDVDL